MATTHITLTLDQLANFVRLSNQSVVRQPDASDIMDQGRTNGTTEVLDVRQIGERINSLRNEMQNEFVLQDEISDIREEWIQELTSIAKQLVISRNNPPRVEVTTDNKVSEW